MKTFRPLFFFASILLIVGLACGGGATPSQPEQPQATQPPVQEPPSTTSPPAVEPTAVPPTEKPAPQAQEYFTEEFDKDPNWDYFLTYGDEDNVTLEFSNSLMIFNLEDLDIYAYYIYEDFTYDDVRVDLRAENRGRNNNNVSLVCRYTDAGWYEFSTEGGGVWYLYAAEPGSDGKIRYNTIANGGALALKQGKEVNEYAMVCDGSEITLFINNEEIKSLNENKYSFNEGNVGFNISSLNVTPIIVEVDWFKISEP